MHRLDMKKYEEKCNRSFPELSIKFNLIPMRNSFTIQIFRRIRHIDCIEKRVSVRITISLQVENHAMHYMNLWKSSLATLCWRMKPMKQWRFTYCQVKLLLIPSLRRSRRERCRWCPDRSLESAEVVDRNFVGLKCCWDSFKFEVCDGDDDLKMKLDFEVPRCLGELSSRELAIDRSIEVQNSL